MRPLQPAGLGALGRWVPRCLAIKIGKRLFLRAIPLPRRRRRRRRVAAALSRLPSRRWCCFSPRALSLRHSRRGRNAGDSSGRSPSSAQPLPLLHRPVFLHPPAVLDWTDINAVTQIPTFVAPLPAR
ncbi:hypothetical protein PVAP13_5KG091674 [Panicum virgatum]|uniref:Uncharacterized protein n=1 Tax=Panicum virgatum TaxID=38727 RepID=A0A8T0SBS3_PANVG|nr:hypothetical protein PVAP13_5KG091674 [Panicum virgatum]